MADSLGALIVSLTCETAAFNDAMTKAAYQTNQAMGQIVSSIDGVAGRLAFLEQAAQALIFSQAIRGAADFVTSMVDAQAHLQDLAVSIGTSASQMSALVPAAVLSGTSLDTAAQATARLERSLSPLSVTSKIAKEALSSLGFSAEDAARFLHDPSEGLLEIAQRLNTFADDGNKTAIVMALMGRGAAEMLPFLKQLGDQTALTATVTDQQAAAAKALVVQWNEVKLRGEELRNTIAAGLIPTMSDLLTAFTENGAAAHDLGAAIRGIAADGTLATWAIEAVRAFVIVGETFNALGHGVAAVGASIIVVIDNLKILQQVGVGVYQQLAAGLYAYSGNYAAAVKLLNSGDAKINDIGNLVKEHNADLKVAQAGWDSFWNDQYDTQSKALSKMLANLDGYRKTFAASIKAMQDLPQNADSTDRHLYGNAAQAPGQKGNLDATAGAAAKVDDLTKAYDSLLASMKKTTEQQTIENASWIQTGSDVKATQTFMVEYLTTQGSLVGLTKQQTAALVEAAHAQDAQNLVAAKHKEQIAQTDIYIKQLTEDWKDYTREVTTEVDVHQKANEQLGKMLESMKTEAETAGMSAIATKEFAFEMEMLHAGIAKGSDLCNNYLAQFREWEQEAENGKAIAHAAQEAQRAWHETARTIADDLTTAFSDWVKGGKNLAQQLRDEVLKLFDSLYLKPMVLGVITSLIGGGSGPAGASGGSGGTAASALSGLSGLDSAFSAITAFPTEVSALFANVSLASSAGLGAIGGLSGLLSSALPVIGPIAAVAMLASSLFSKGGGPKDGGSASNIPGADRFYTPNQADASLQQLVASDTSAYNSTLAALGGTGTAGFGFGYDIDSKGTANSRLSTAATVNGQSVYGFTNRDEGRGDAGVKADLSLEAQRALLAALQASNLPKDIANILDSIVPANASADQVQQVIELASAYSDLGKMLKANPIADAMDAFAKSSQGAFGTFSNATDAYKTLLSTYDGSTTATVALDKASQAYYASLVALLAQIQQVKASIDAMFSSTIRNFQIQSLDKQGQYAYYQQDAQSTLSGIRTATDPQVIQRLETQYNADLTSAFGLLDQSQRTALLSQFIDAANTGDAAGNTRLTQIGANAAGTFNDNITAAQAAITKAATDMATAAGTIKDSSTTISTASGNILRASNTPVHVVLTVNTTTGEVNQGG